MVQGKVCLDLVDEDTQGMLEIRCIGEMEACSTGCWVMGKRWSCNINIVVVDWAWREHVGGFLGCVIGGGQKRGQGPAGIVINQCFINQAIVGGAIVIHLKDIVDARRSMGQGWTGNSLSDWGDVGTSHYKRVGCLHSNLSKVSSEMRWSGHGGTHPGNHREPWQSRWNGHPPQQGKMLCGAQACTGGQGGGIVGLAHLK